MLMPCFRSCNGSAELKVRSRHQVAKDHSKRGDESVSRGEALEPTGDTTLHGPMYSRPESNYRCAGFFRSDSIILQISPTLEERIAAGDSISSCYAVLITLWTPGDMLLNCLDFALGTFVQSVALDEFD
jgi:hypothetical protein